MILIDLETRSGADLGKSGLHKYVEDEEFAILLVGFKIDDRPTVVLDLENSEDDRKYFRSHLIPMMLSDCDRALVAFNVDFELTCLSKVDTRFIHTKHKWVDVQTMALHLGLPASLKNVLGVLRMDNKDSAGTALINKFSKPTGKGFRVPYSNLSTELKADWDRFKEYAHNDVEREYELYHELKKPHSTWPTTKFELATDRLSDKINRRGVGFDKEFAEWINIVYTSKLVEAQLKLAELTQLPNPNSPVQFSGWLRSKGINVTSVARPILRAIETDDPLVKEVIELRLDAGSAIPKKYLAGVNHVMNDGRLRGLFKYYGANRTGRWTSSGYQLHNLARTKTEVALELIDLYEQNKTGKISIDEALTIVEQKAVERKMPVSTYLGQCVRSVIIPKVDHEFYMADFSAIEARVAAWLAGETWVIKVFEEDGLIYERTAAKMFNVSVVEAKQPDMRDKGKYAVLALGYGGGIQALCNFGADKVMSHEEMDELVKAWRAANPNITRMWRQLESKFREAFNNPGVVVRVSNNVAFNYDADFDVMHMILPSGRTLAYYSPRVSRREIKYLNAANMFSGVWDTTYGGKLMENLCQAVARDFLANFMLNLDESGYDIVLHVHDEAVVEVLMDTLNNVVEDIKLIGSKNPEWGQGIPLDVDVTPSKFFAK